jgi:uncharacterized protein with GYD domain
VPRFGWEMEDDMKYAIFFALKPETIAAAMERPSDRTAVVGALLESVAGQLEAYYWMCGKYDGFVIADISDSMSAAAISLAVLSTGAFAHLETHELIPADQIESLLERAKVARSEYTAPGS